MVARTEAVFAERPQSKGYSYFMGSLFCIFVLLAFVQFFAMTPSYYEWRFHELGVAQTTGLDEKGLSIAAEGISDFLAKREPEFKAMVTQDGVEKDIFNEREKAHMADVKVLFAWVRLIQFIVVGVAAVMVGLRTAFGMSRTKIYVFPIFRAALICSIGTTVVLGLLSFVDFTGVFIAFHEALFTNDLWLLDPKTSVLINLLPEKFFSGFVLHVLAVTFGVSGLMFGIFQNLTKKADMKQGEKQGEKQGGKA